MTATQSPHPRRAIFCTCLLLLAMGTERLVQAKDALSPDNIYLDALRGDWDMTGTFRGKPLRYHARGQRVLQGGFLRLHMIDAAEVPAYEAIALAPPARAGDSIPLR
jgi:hypothetical protein